MHNGAKCQSPALNGKDFCYHHFNRHAPKPLSSPDEAFRLPFLEDRSAIQVALSKILDDLGNSKLDPKRAGLLLYGLQIASQNVERKHDILPYKAVESVTHSRKGVELGPKLRICNSDDDCSLCDQRETCPDSGPAEDPAEG